MFKPFSGLETHLSKIQNKKPVQHRVKAEPVVPLSNIYFADLNPPQRGRVLNPLANKELSTSESNIPALYRASVDSVGTALILARVAELNPSPAPLQLLHQTEAE